MTRGGYQVEYQIIAFIFGLALARLGWRIMVPALQTKSSMGVVMMLLLSGLILLIGLTVYREWIYSIGRSGWAARMVVNVVTVLSFLVLYFYF